MKKAVHQQTAAEIEYKYRGTAAERAARNERNTHLLRKIMERVNEPAEAIRRAQGKFAEEQELQRLRSEVAVSQRRKDWNDGKLAHEDWTTKDLLAKSKLSKNTLTAWLAGKNSPSARRGLMRAYGCSVDDLPK